MTTMIGPMLSLVLAMMLAGCGGTGGGAGVPIPPGPGPAPGPEPGPGPGPGPGPMPPSAGTPAVRQFATIDTQQMDGTQVLTVRFPEPTLAGSAIFAWSRSSIDGQTDVFATFSDDRGNVYVPTGDTEIDDNLLVNAAQATAYAANVAAGTQQISATWGPFSDFRSIVVAEISGVSAQPFLASASSTETVSAGTDTIRSGPFTVSVQPALIIAISSNESQVNGPPFAPLAGSGYTSLATTTSYGLGNDFTRLTARLTTTTGEQQAVFSAPVRDEYLTFAVVFR